MSNYTPAMNDKKDLNKIILLETEHSKLWAVENYTIDYYNDVKNIELDHEIKIIVYGKPAKQHRDSAFFSDDSEGYKFSGQIQKSRPLSEHKIFTDVISSINNDFDYHFNGILVNKYANGEKYIGAHSDDERGLDKNNKAVASICYGPGIRNFRIRDKKTKKVVLNYEHKPMTLLVMEGEFQKEFTHEIPIQKKIIGERISLTFRSHTS
jgi:alkylated DNA repair dioxygenase AlkB